MEDMVGFHGGRNHQGRHLVIGKQCRALKTMKHHFTRMRLASLLWISLLVVAD